MSILNHQIWIDSSCNLDAQVNKLFEIFSNMENKNILISPEYREGFDHVLSTSYKDVILEKEQFGNIGFYTSGTSGIPKVVWKNYYDLIKNIKISEDKNDKWLLTYNPARWAGFSVLLHCIKYKNIIVPDNLEIKSLINYINNANVTHVSLTPSLFRKILIFGEAIKPIKQIVFGGEWADQKTIDEARSIWPNAKITTVYASTELGYICSCSDGLEGFPIGLIKNKYLSDEGELIINNFQTGDFFKIEKDRLIFCGRKSDIINVGGYKVHSLNVESEIYKIFGINECRVFPVKNSLLGEVIGLEYSGDIDIKTLKNKLLELPRLIRPLDIKKVNSVELSMALKTKRSE